MPRKPSKAELARGAKYHTKYLGPTDTKGARIAVKTMSTGKTRMMPYDYAAKDAHEAAVQEVMGSRATLQRVDDGSTGYYWK